MFMNAELKQRLDCEIMMLEKEKREYETRLENLQKYKGSRLRRAKPGKNSHLN